jgi:DNA-binding MarR family transcriptional regulator
MGTQISGRTRDSKDSGASGDPFDLIETEIAILMRTLSRRRTIKHSLDRASYIVARVLAASGPYTIVQLASILGLDPTTVTRQVTVMVEAGLVTRRPHPSSGRYKLVALTPKGRRSMVSDQAERRQWFVEHLADWDADDRLELGRMLARFNDSLADTEAFRDRA